MGIINAILPFFKLNKEDKKEDKEVIQEPEKEEEFPRPASIPEFPLTKFIVEAKPNPRFIDGTELVGLSAQLKRAKENIKYCSLAHESRPICICGPRRSGKSLLAKAIMQDNGIRYEMIDLQTIQSPQELLLKLELLSPVNKGIILEGAEEVTDWSVLEALNRILTEKEIETSYAKKTCLYQLAIIVPINKKNPYLNLKNSLTITIGYKRDDYVKFYLRACKDAGYDFPENKVHIDNKALSFMGGILGNDIVIYREWVVHLMEMAEKKGKMMINMENIMDIMSQLLDFDR